MTVYSIQIHPVYADIVQTHKVLDEREFDDIEEAHIFMKRYNDDAQGVIAVYNGMIDAETGENL